MVSFAALNAKAMTAKALRVFVAACSFFVGAGTALCADPPTPPTNSFLRLYFLTNSSGETLVRHGEKAGALPAIAEKTLNVSQALTNRGAQYSLIPEEATVAVLSEQFPGWTAE